jgi:hypothetical protein
MTTEEQLKYLAKEVETFKYKQNELLSKLDKIETALVGNEDYQQEGLISMIKRHDALFVKMSHLGRFTIAIFSIGAAVGTAITWIVQNAKFISNLFANQQ